LPRDQSKVRSGKVLLGERSDKYRIPFATFAKSVAEILDQEVIEGLQSGIFEGEILSTKAKLHASRTRFEPSDHLLGLCLNLSAWYRTIGKPYVEEAEEAKQEKRYQELGARSMKAIENILRNPRFSHFIDAIKAFQIGTTGRGHANVPPAIVLTKQPEPSISPDGTGEGNGKGGSRSSRPSENPDHIPATVLGPRGKTRTQVRGNSLGIQFSYDLMDRGTVLWELDAETGILHFNVRHPFWVMCDERDKVLMQLQEFIAVMALTLYSLPEQLRVAQREIFDRAIEAQAFLIAQGEVQAGKKPLRLLKK